MKTMTTHLLRFAVVALLLTIGFRFFLSYGIENRSEIIIIISAIVYAASMFVAGLYFGTRDGDYMPFYDIGFRFHLVTYLIHNAVSELWFVLGFNSTLENIRIAHMVAIYWGIFLLLHFLIFLWMRKKSINGLDKTDLFE